MNKKALNTFVGLLLASCAAGPQLPPGAPTMKSIDTAYTELNTSTTPPEAILTIGLALDDEECYGWLDQQILASQQSSAAQGALGMVGAVAAATGHPAGIGAAVGTGALSSLIGNAQANSPIGNDPVAAYGLVVRQRQLWQASVGRPLTKDVAWSFVQSYHQLCSLGGIRLAMHMAALTVPLGLASQNQYLAAAIVPERQRPPVVVVGPQKGVLP